MYLLFSCTERKGHKFTLVVVPGDGILGDGMGFRGMAG